MTVSDLTLVRVVQTSSACPSQWDAWDADGNYYYLRYRHAHGTVERHSGPEWWKTEEMDEELDRLHLAARAMDHGVDEKGFEDAWDAYHARYKHLYLVADFTHGHPLDGYIELPEFCLRAGIGLSEELQLTDFNNYFAGELKAAIAQVKAEREAGSAD